MQMDREIARRVSRLERLMARHMGMRRGDLSVQMRRARRGLPGAVRRDMAALVEARHLSGHPRIARQLDRRALAQAERRARGWLTGPAPRRARETRRLRWRGTLVFNLALVGGALAGFARWQGLY